MIYFNVFIPLLIAISLAVVLVHIVVSHKEYQRRYFSLSGTVSHVARLRHMAIKLQAERHAVDIM